MTRAAPQHLPRRKMRGQPLVFLATVVLSWSVARVIHHLPGEALEQAAQSGLSFAAETRGMPRSLSRAPETHSGPRTVMERTASSFMRGEGRPVSLLPPSGVSPRPSDSDLASVHLPWVEGRDAPPGSTAPPRLSPVDGPLPIAPEQAWPALAGAGPGLVPSGRTKAWSIYGWSLLRQGSGGSTLAPGAQYGGSQAGLILRYAPAGDTPLAPALYARAASALANADDRTVAIGAAVRPWRALPFDLAVERRFAVGTRQRDRFAAMLVAGGGTALGASQMRVDAFGQAGIVGRKDTHGFFDLQVLAMRPVVAQDGYAVSLGGGLWAGGQQEIDGAGGKNWVHRVDVGPRAALAFPIKGSQVTVALDWRQRIDGQARPASGAALTVSTGF